MARDTFDPNSDVLGSSAGGFNPRGVWNSSLSIKRLDVVSYLGNSYVAVADVATGGQSPAVDTANWMLHAAGGGEIAAAEVTSNFVPTLTAATLTDIPGASIVVPAGVGTYEARASAPMIQVVFAAGATAGTQATVRLFLVDDANVAIAQSIWRVSAGAASAVQWGQSRVERRMPATSTAKTIKLSAWFDTITNITSVTFWCGTGAGTPPGTSTIGPLTVSAVSR